MSRSGADFDAFVASLGEGFRTLAPDLLGHGGQDRSDQYRLADYRHALLDLIRQRPEGHHLYIYGHSLGGLVAIALAERLGSQVAGLVLEDAPLFEVDWPRFRDGPFYDGFRVLRDRLAAGPVDAAELARDVATWPSGHGDTTYGDQFGPDGVVRRVADLMALDPRALEAPMTGGLMGAVDIRRALGRVACPVHLLAGNRDHGSAISASDLDEFLEVCPGGQVQRFPHLGHDIRLYEQKACMDVLRAMAAR